MKSDYSTLVDELKIKVKNIINFKKCMKLINSGDYNTIIEKTNNDYEIGCIIQQLKFEKKVQSTKYDLSELNRILKIFGEKEQDTIPKAINVYKNKIFINIYDLLDERYDMRKKSKADLVIELQNNPDKRFPLKSLKNGYDKNLKVFLTKTI
jgi:hypothetical protein